MRDTIDMAREANLAKYGDGLREGVAAFINALERFEALARADEREACAKVCDTTPPYPFRPSIEAAHAIRARGNA
jgi:hypothetical protein